MDKQKVYYTIHFEDEGTGENFDSYVFTTKDELYSHSGWEYPGYGIQWCKEINRETAIEMVLEEIERFAERCCATKYEKIEEYVKYKEPGWQLLKEEYNFLFG